MAAWLAIDWLSEWFRCMEADELTAAEAADIGEAIGSVGRAEATDATADCPRMDEAAAAAEPMGLAVRST